MRRSVILDGRRLVLLALVAAALSGSGCVPGTTWLPDSSGFVYTGGKDCTKLFYFDVKKGERQLLVADTGAPTMWPAVSPDGQRIAVARFIGKPMQKQIYVQVAVYDRTGTEVQRSKELECFVLEKVPMKEEVPMGGKPKKDANWPQLFWAPKGDRILVNIFGFTAIYDVQTQKVIWSSPGVVLIFRGGPIRPDGAGFLVMKSWTWLESIKDGKAGVKDPHFVFVDWAGKEQPIKAPAQLLDPKAIEKEKDPGKLLALLMPVLFESGWEDDVAQVRHHVDCLRYFTKKGEAVLDNVQPVLTEGGLVQCQYRFKGAQAELRIVMMTELKDNRPENLKGFRVEVLKPGKKEAEILVPDANMPVLVPAPNGMLATVICVNHDREKMPGPGLILVVNDKGEMVAKPGVE